MNNKYSHNADHLDTYDAEIIEDIPEQFDLNRYKKSSQSKSSAPQQQQLDAQYRAAPPTPQTPHQTTSAQFAHTSSMYPNHHHSSNLVHDSYISQTPTSAGVRELDYSNYKQVMSPHSYNEYVSYPTKKLTKSQMDSSSQPPLYNTAPASTPQQFYQYVHPVSAAPAGYQYTSANSNYVSNPIQTPTPTQRYISQDYGTITTSSGTPSNQVGTVQYSSSGYETVTKKKSSSKYDYEPHKVTTSSGRYQASPTSTSNPPWTTRARSDERKKSSYENEENESLSYEKKEYYLKGGDDVPRDKKWLINKENLEETVKKQPITKTDAYSRSDSGSIHFSQSNEPKSNIKPAIKKHGVKFDEKLEVYEVKNLHYGLEVKSEKRELKKKKKDRQKEEETFHKTKLDLKAKIQTQNMILCNVSLKI